MKMPLELSWPPSVNHYWRHVVMRTKSGKLHVNTLISAPGRAYKRQIAVEVAQHSRRDEKCDTRPFTGRIRMDVVLFAPDRHSYDIDNRLKALLDALVEAHVMLNDNQVDIITVRRGPVMAGGMVRVWIQEINTQGKLV